MAELETIQSGITIPLRQLKLVAFQTKDNFYYCTSDKLNICSLNGSITNKDIAEKKWKLIGVGDLTEWNDP